MKEFKKEGFSLYEKKDEANLPAKFTSASNGRLTVGLSYTLLGFCHVPETKRKDGQIIRAWDGVALEAVVSKKAFPVGLATLQGIGFEKSTEGKYTVSTVSKQLFEDAPAIAKAFKTAIKVESIEKLDVTPYSEDGSTDGTSVKKDFYVFVKA